MPAHRSSNPPAKTSSRSTKAAAVADPKLPVPMYRQIFDLLREQIVGGTLGPGDPLPPEIEIERIHGVSRITARRALNEPSTWPSADRWGVSS